MLTRSETACKAATAPSLLSSKWQWSLGCALGGGVSFVFSAGMFLEHAIGATAALRLSPSGCVVTPAGRGAASAGGRTRAAVCGFRVRRGRTRAIACERARAWVSLRARPSSRSPGGAQDSQQQASGSGGSVEDSDSDGAGAQLVEDLRGGDGGLGDDEDEREDHGYLERLARARARAQALVPPPSLLDSCRSRGPFRKKSNRTPRSDG